MQIQFFTLLILVVIYIFKILLALKYHEIFLMFAIIGADCKHLLHNIYKFLSIDKYI